MASGSEKVWIGNYVNQKDEMIFEVQMLTETKEEAYEKYVKYFKEEIYNSETGEGDENYKICTIDALIEGRGIEELERDRELSWFYNEELMVDSDKGMDSLTETELENLLSNLIIEEPLVTEKDLAWVRDLAKQDNPGGVEKFKANLVIKTSTELDEDKLEAISLQMLSGEAIEDFSSCMDCPEDFKYGYIIPEVLKHVVGKLYDYAPQYSGLYDFIRTSLNFEESELSKALHDIMAAYWVSIEHVTHTGIKISRSVNIKALYDHIESHWAIQTKVDNLYKAELLGTIDYEELMDAYGMDEYDYLIDTFGNCGYGYLFGSDLLCPKDYSEINIKFYFDSSVFDSLDATIFDGFKQYIDPYKEEYQRLNDLLSCKFENLYRHNCYFVDININKKKQCVLFTEERNVSIENFRAIRYGLNENEICELSLVEIHGNGCFIGGESTSVGSDGLKVGDFTDEVQRYLREDVKVLGFGLVKYGKTFNLQPVDNMVEELNKIGVNVGSN